MCDCIENITETTRKKIKAEVESQTPVFKWRDEGDFMHKGISFTGNPTRIGMPFTVEFYRQKKNGDPETKITNKHLFIYPSFCPFCGEKYKL